MVEFDKISKEEKIKLADKMLKQAKHYTNKNYPMTKTQLEEELYYACRIASNELYNLLYEKANLKLD